jgi:hypothetical protein
MVTNPRFDFPSSPDLALDKFGVRPREVGAAGQLMGTLSADAEAASDLAGAHQRRFGHWLIVAQQLGAGLAVVVLTVVSRRNEGRVHLGLGRVAQHISPGGSLVA